MMAAPGTVQSVSFSTYRRNTIRLDRPLPLRLLPEWGRITAAGQEPAGEEDSINYSSSSSSPTWRAKIHGPDLVRSGWTEALLSMHHGPSSSRGSLAQPQSLFFVQPIDKVLANLPALTVQQHADPPIPVAHPGLRDFPDAHPQLDPLLLVAFVAIRRPGQLQNTACVPFAHSIALLEVLHHRAAPRGLHNFFLSTSCNIVLSNVSSATNCFSRVFSSRSCFSCRTWST